MKNKKRSDSRKSKHKSYKVLTIELPFDSYSGSDGTPRLFSEQRISLYDAGFFRRVDGVRRLPDVRIRIQLIIMNIVSGKGE